MFDNRAKGLIMTKADNDVVGDDVRKVAELAKDIRIGMLTTVDADGTFVSRPMGQQEVEFDGDLWYFAERDSRKIRHIAADPHVGVTLSSGDTWISIDGTAEIVDDTAKTENCGTAGSRPGCRRARTTRRVVLIKVNGEPPSTGTPPAAGSRR